jgi:hypothetical protein
VPKIPDENFEKVIRNNINKLTGELTSEDLAGIYNLHIFNTEGSNDVSDISGVEYCVNLTCLTISHTQITDFEPLSKMINLREKYNITTISQAVIPYKNDIIVNGEDIINGVTKMFYYNIEMDRIVDFSYCNLKYLNLNKNYNNPFEIYFHNNFCFVIYLRSWNIIERCLNIFNKQKKIVCQFEFDSPPIKFFKFYEYNLSQCFITISNSIIMLFDYEKETFIKLYRCTSQISDCFYDYSKKEIYLRFYFSPHYVITIEDFNDFNDYDYLTLKDPKKCSHKILNELDYTIDEIKKIEDNTVNKKH